jgi:predicted dehydrogenase
MDATVLQYHWNDRAKLCNDYRYLQDLYERLLLDLASQLNKIHGANHGVRYWRILIGPWLGYFTQILFDRWTSIQQAVCQPQVSGTIHFAPAKMALENGFNVVIEKPITFSLDEAKELKKLVEQTGLVLCLTHTYSGYPLVKQAKAMINDGVLGKIRKVLVEYPQGWLTKLSEREGNQQAAWRTDPKKSGKSGCMGDIGTHAAHLSEYVTGLKITHLCADLNVLVDGRALDDDGNVLLKFNNGAAGVLMASQVAAGEENALKIRVYGEKGGIEWAQQEPNTLIVKWYDAPTQILRAGSNYGDRLSTYATSNCRTPGGHPEGYLEAFANIYKNFATTLSAKLEGTVASKEAQDFPSVEDGIRGMAFIDNVVLSGQSDKKWTEFVV